MGSVLGIGRLPDGLQQAAKDYVAIAVEAGANAPDIAWEDLDYGLARIDAMNLASISLFLAHAAHLEGRPSDVPSDKSRWRHLPYWMHSLWLPVQTTRAEFVSFVDRDKTESVFCASSYALLVELREIASLSSANLTNAPPQFKLMLSDPEAFYQLPRFDEVTTLQFIWCAFHEAAILSIKYKAPMWG